MRGMLKGARSMWEVQLGLGGCKEYMRGETPRAYTNRHSAGQRICARDCTRGAVEVGEGGWGYEGDVQEADFVLATTTQ